MARQVFERSGPVNRPSGNRGAGPLPKTMRISDRDRGAAERIRLLLESGALRIGVLENEAAKPHAPEEGEPDRGITIGELAAIHEFGLGVPRRSFLADWVDERRAEIENVIIRGGRSVALGKTSVRQTLEQIGQWAVGSIQSRIADNIPPPLAPSTIARKGSSVALIHTGQLRSSITYEVDDGKIGVADRVAGGA